MPETKSAELCWGQRYHWLRYHRVPAGTRHDAHIVANCPLPDGVSVENLRATMTYLVRRHESLRTVYDLAAQPAPLQRVEPPGPVDLRVVTTERDGTPAPAEVIRELTVRDFDLAHERPIRACAVTTGGVPKQLVVVLNHIAFDDWSLDSFRREFQEVLAAVVSRRRAALPPVPHQPADLARHESSRPAGEVAEALGYWKAEISRLPADVFARRRVSGISEVSAFSASLTTPSLLAAARGIASRHRVWPSAVHLAAYAVAMAAYTGEETVAHKWFTSHREPSGHLSVLTCMFSPTLVTVDLGGDPTFSEVVRRTAARVEEAQAHAYVPYDEIVDRMSREGARRGQAVRVEAELNFLSHAPQSCGTRRERFAWNPTPAAWAESDTDVYFRVYEWQDGVTVALHASSAVMDAEAVERFLRGYARLLEAHADEATDLPLSEAVAEFGFAPIAARRIVRVGPDAVDAEACEAALLAHPAVRSALVGVSAAGLAADVVADVVADGPLTPAQLRRHVLSSGSVRCPDWFRIGEIEGDGRDAEPLRPATDAERALATAVATANGLPDTAIDLADSYVEAGGRALRAPHVVAVLVGLGWSGPGVSELAGPRPLYVLARGLAPAAVGRLG